MKDAASFNALSRDKLPGLLGISIIESDGTGVVAEMPVTADHLAPNGYLHAGAVVSLADTACGHGCMVNLPEGAQGFTTVELKSNHLGTVLEGIIACRATAAHLGRTTQVWDAVVARHDTGKTLALFRCTQMILYPGKR